VTIRLRINDRQFQQLMDDMPDAVRDSWRLTGAYFKRVTPKRSGNARKRTRTTQREIIAEYPYANRLDNGYSKQAPDGMTTPSVKYFQQQLNSYLRRV
jgi:hypothetical protein